jgi:hypothetical protein
MSPGLVTTRIVIACPRKVDVLAGVDEVSAVVPDARVSVVKRRRWMWFRRRVVIEVQGSDADVSEFRRELNAWGADQLSLGAGPLSNPW